LEVSFGLNYHYYSTRIATGAKIDSNLTMYANYAIVQTNGYYRPGNSSSYLNQYHFIELPVLLKVRLNRSVRMPLTAQGGLALSELISSNALQYNQGAGVYYKDNSLFSKTQCNLSVGLMLGLSGRSVMYQIGPEFQYGLTSLLKNSGAEKEHFLSAAIKVVFIPSKKH